MVIILDRGQQHNMAATYLFKTITIALACGLAQPVYAKVEKYKPFNPDPLEKLNRRLFQTNKIVDSLYIKPAAKAYETVLPYPAQMSVSNFIGNIGEVPVVINGILQGKFEQAVRDTFRFGINSTLGLLGLFDVATQMGLEAHKEDFGKTLYAWGWKESYYFVIPILGPSTIRDAVGVAGNLFISAPSYFKPKWRNRYYALTLLDKRTKASEFEGIAGAAGINYYNLVRSSYLQNREYQLTDGKVPLKSNTGGDLLGEPPA